jgi:glycosyltransferase involved in cell wall biosynthesis
MESLLSQKDYIYEICINDDCSQDRTFEILQEYERQYPNLIKPVQNEHNLGIFANLEAVWKRLTGDIIYAVSGDDEAGEGYLKAVLDFINEKKIDWKNELFCIYGDYMQVNSDGTSIVFHQKLVNDKNALKLKVRKLLSGRSACYSKKVLDKFEDVSDGRSFRVELTQDSQLQLFTEHNYYLPVIGNIYYAEIGISSRMNKEEHMENTLKGYDMFVDFLNKHNIQLDKKDLAFIEYMKAYRLHDMKRTLQHYIKSIDLSLGIRGLNLDRIFFVLRKKKQKK